MKNLFLILLTTTLLSACSSAPTPKEPEGNWQPVNNRHYYAENA